MDELDVKELERRVRIAQGMRNDPVTRLASLGGGVAIQTPTRAALIESAKQWHTSLREYLTDSGVHNPPAAHCCMITKHEVANIISRLDRLGETIDELAKMEEGSK